MRPSFISFGFVDWRMNTVEDLKLERNISCKIEKSRTIFVANTFTYRHTGFLIRVLQDQDFGHFNAQSAC